MNLSDDPNAPQHVETDDGDRSPLGELREWLRNQLPWWMISFTAHVVALASLLLIGRFALPVIQGDDIPTFSAPIEAASKDDPPLKNFDPGLPDDRPLPIDVNAPLEFVAQPNNDVPPGEIGTPNAASEVLGGNATSDVVARMAPFAPSDVGTGPRPSSALIGTANPPTNPFGERPGVVGGSNGPRKLGPPGPTKITERTVAAAIYWLARHQSRDGSWSLQDYMRLCKDTSCSGAGGQESIPAATAMGVLPLLGAGLTPTTPGRFQPTVARAIYWLVSHQKPNGDLSAGAAQQMYSHALATIALCEDYGMTRDKAVGAAAQRAINFIESAQNAGTGGWRYRPGEEGDTSVTGWQLMALKSGQMAKLAVNPTAFDGVKRWLKSVAKTPPGGASGAYGRFSYLTDGAATPSMSAVGLLCSQYMRAGRGDPVIVGGVQYLMANPPDEQARDIYYWYYATQVMHNMNNSDWDAWNRKLRRILVDTQIREGCAAGSWDPDKPVRDAWGIQGGRIITTSLSALTLEVYYRYLPLYQLDQPD